MQTLERYDLLSELSLVVLVISLATAITAIQLLYEGDIPGTSLKLSIGDYPANCTNLTLPDTAYCLRDELRTFFKYNYSNVGKELTFPELVEQGGVCSHYSEWYYDKLKNLGFYVKTVSMDLDLNSDPMLAHEIAIASNTEAYCVFDQRYVSCMAFANLTSNERR